MGNIWEEVQSTQISAFKYDSEAQTLTIRFNGGGEYEYYKVPAECVSGFRAAESKGSFHGRYIRTKFEYKEVGDAPAEIVQKKEPTDIKLLKEQIDPVVIRANALAIKSHMDAQIASSERLIIKDLIAKVKADFKDSKEAAHAAHKTVCAQEKGHLDPLESADQILTAKLLLWEKSERERIAIENEKIRKEAEAIEKKRREEEEVARKERQRIEDARIAKERAELEAEKERIRRETESRDKALKEAGLVEEAKQAKARAEAEAYLAEITQKADEEEQRAERARQDQLAASLANQPIYVPTVVIETPKIDGFTSATIWKAEVTDMRKLMQAILSTRPDLIDCVLPNEALLNSMAKMHKKEDFGVPGVRGTTKASGRSAR